MTLSINDAGFLSHPLALPMSIKRTKTFKVHVKGSFSLWTASINNNIKRVGCPCAAKTALTCCWVMDPSRPLQVVCYTKTLAAEHWTPGSGEVRLRGGLQRSMSRFSSRIVHIIHSFVRSFVQSRFWYNDTCRSIIFHSELRLSFSPKP